MTNTPKTWGEMTPEEKGALLLAEHEGREIEDYALLYWTSNSDPRWHDWCAYRVKPEAKTATARVCIGPTGVSWTMCQHDDNKSHGNDCHYATLTFQLKPDGTADWSTAKLEALE